MSRSEGEWVNTPRRRRATLRYVERQAGDWGDIQPGDDLVIKSGDTAEVAETAHPKETFEHTP